MLPPDRLAYIYQKWIRNQCFTAAQNLPQGTGLLTNWKEEDMILKFFVALLWYNASKIL